MPKGIYKRIKGVNYFPEKQGFQNGKNIQGKPMIKTGDKFNRLTAIKFVDMRMNSQQFWLFKCECGNEKVISVNSVKIGTTKSCGCLSSELLKKRSKHGMCKTKIYKIWAVMLQRCFNQDNKGYKNYGGRGIKVCSEWLKFENFYKDMGDKPEGMTLDRKNNNLGYCKSNCKWSNRKEQNNNKRNNILITYKNKTQTLSQWAEELNINYNIFFYRFKSGWDIKKILTKYYEQKV